MQFSGKRQKLFIFAPPKVDEDFYQTTSVVVRNPQTAVCEEMGTTKAFKKFHREGWQIVSANNFHPFLFAKVLWSPEELYVDADNEQLKTVRLEIGAHAEPDFVIDFKMKLISEPDQLFLRTNLTKICLTPGDRLEELKVVVDLELAKKLFAKYFISCAGGAVIVNSKKNIRQTKQFSPELRKDFLNAIDPFFQNLLLAALIY